LADNLKAVPKLSWNGFFFSNIFRSFAPTFMKTAIPFILLISLIVNAFAGSAFPKGGRTKGDSIQTLHKPIFKRRKEDIPSLVIEKMSDSQLMLLIDHMFEASYIPPDLWNQVLIETAKRNLSNINRHSFNPELVFNKQSGCLHIEKLKPDSVAPVPDSDPMSLYPASSYYNEWGADLSALFKDQFTSDASYTIELENSDFGCFKMPSWGPLSSPFGWRENRYHKGIDIQLRKGDTITCAFDGMVRFAQKKGGYGNVVIVRHYNGLETVYAHLSKIKVNEGDVIGAGDLIGLAGSTGHSTGPHLHFEIRFMGAPVDPQYFISFDYGNPLFNTVSFKKNKSGLLSAFSPETEFHTVTKGETFVEIANHYGTTTQKLRSMNDMAQRQYIRLKQGQILRVRTTNHPDPASMSRR
jgi:murein DD-endopeptidase MepM/ murein hydrolase activator NlpD